jgi:dienelactone hydrolase
VALFHGSTGILPYHHRWAEWLVTEGYVALVVDSYGPRRVDKDSGGLTGERVWDAFGALAYLRSLGFVEKNNIGAMGWSLGGGVALLASGELFATQAPGPGTFSAVVAFYPACALTDASEIVIPVLFLLAADDTWAPPERCVQIGRTLKDNGKPVELAVYPGATHGFDFGRGDATASSINVGGHVLKYDERATVDAETRTRDFLGRHLRHTR